MASSHNNTQDNYADYSSIADTHDTIEVHGARENNLKDVSVTLPKRRLTVFTGVSGSGKSSLVFDTIAAESRRLINETYSSFVQSFMGSMNRPEVDSMSGLTPAIIVDQERMGANSRSTLGTVTDMNALLRILFSRKSEPHIGGTEAFSFNTASAEGQGSISVGGGKKEVRRFSITGGQCPVCEGMGQISDIDLDELYDSAKSLAEGAITIPGYTADGWNVRVFAQSPFLDENKPIKDYSEQELQDFLYKDPVKVKIGDMNLTYEGLVPKIQKSMLSKDRESMQAHIGAFVDRAVRFKQCPSCHGTRLNELARSAKIEGKSIADLCAMPIAELKEWFDGYSDPEMAPLVGGIKEQLQFFVEIGLGYLTLDRASGTLSGGEAQRTKMIRHLGSALTDVTYVFDEPTTGLHPHDISRMNKLLLKLRDKGNTVLVVEHKPEVIAIADHIVDMGPRAGVHGGEICYQGSVEGLRNSGTLTGNHLEDRTGVKDSVRPSAGTIEIRGANANNLNNVDVDIPLGNLVAVTGVAGSGKSSLIHSSMPASAEVISIDQGQIKGSRRSNPATYTGMLDSIRKAFAKANGVKPALFSANSQGACENCKGNGVIYTDLGVMGTSETECPVCEGKRFQPEVLEYTFGGKNISEVLLMPVHEALEFFAQPDSKIPAAVTILKRLDDVGLGYIALGQSLNTLSGGERQRLKLATNMGDKGGVYVLDEPTTGLHMADVDNLLGLLDRLVDSGKTVIVIEHNQAVIAHADHAIDIGPGAGTEGGNVVFTGTPYQLATEARTLTGQHLSEYLQAIK